MTAGFIGISALAPAHSFAASSKNQVLQGVNDTGDCNNRDCADKQVTNLFSTIVNILSYVVGVVAIIMIIVSGAKYMTAAGDSGAVENAKNTLVYALIGLAIAALAQFLVRFVLSAAN